MRGDVAFACEQFEMSDRQACKLVEMDRSSYCYEPRSDHNAKLREELVSLAKQKPRYGYLGMESIIRRRGYQTLEDAGDISGSHNSSFGVDEPATVARMLAWIDALLRGQHFFLTYLPIAAIILMPRLSPARSRQRPRSINTVTPCTIGTFRLVR